MSIVLQFNGWALGGSLFYLKPLVEFGVVIGVVMSMDVFSTSKRLMLMWPLKGLASLLFLLLALPTYFDVYVLSKIEMSGMNIETRLFVYLAFIIVYIITNKKFVHEEFVVGQELDTSQFGELEP